MVSATSKEKKRQNLPSERIIDWWPRLDSKEIPDYRLAWD